MEEVAEEPAGLQDRRVGRRRVAPHVDEPVDQARELPVLDPDARLREGPRAVAAFRQLAGGTDPVEKATPGTIRGDLGLETQFNLVHGSDSPDSAVREIELWFPGR